MSIKAKQVAGVTTLVLVIVAVLSGYHLATLTRLSLQETEGRAQLLSRAIFQRAREVVAQGAQDPYEALREDRGIRSILESSIGYSAHVTYAAITNPDGVAVAHSFLSQQGMVIGTHADFADVVKSGPIDQLRAVYSDQTFEIREPMLAGDIEFGSIRIGVSPLLVRNELRGALETAASYVLIALLVSMMVAALLAQWIVRPIHVIQSGLSRLGRGELDVRLDLPGTEFKDLGSSFEAVSKQLAALGARSGVTQEHAAPDGSSIIRTGGGTDLESVMENLEDAVALFSPSGELIFCNAAMRHLHFAELPANHPARQLVDRTLAGRASSGPLSVSFTHDRTPDAAARAGDASQQEPAVESEHLLMCHAIEDQSGRFLGAMLVVRNLAYLTQVHSTLNYSRKLAALGRLLAGVAHEVKNPLNAMAIHLELLKNKIERVREPAVVAAGGSVPFDQAQGKNAANPPDLSKHVNVIASEIRRLDEVVGGFLKFSRPEELKLQPINLTNLIGDVVTTVTPDAERRRVTIQSECAPNVPDINADPGMLSQALLNLAINAIQAMPEGGTLRLACRPASRRRVQVDVEDTGVGIPPEHLSKIFDLYFTTKEKGTGIGLSMVYRIVQLHDGGVEVQSTPGRGTSFRLLFPQA